MRRKKKNASERKKRKVENFLLFMNFLSCQICFVSFFLSLKKKLFFSPAKGFSKVNALESNGYVDRQIVSIFYPLDFLFLQLLFLKLKKNLIK